MKLVCPECRRENEPERIYCHDCGARLDRSALRREKPKEEDPQVTQRRLRSLFDPRGILLRHRLLQGGKLIVGALVFAVLVQMFRAPDLPAPSENFDLTSQINLDLETAATSAPGGPSLHYSEDQMNAFLSYTLKGKRKKLSSYFQFERAVVAFEEGVCRVTVQRSLFGWSVFTATAFAPRIDNGAVSARTTAGSIGRLPIHPALMQYGGFLFSDLLKVMDSDRRSIAKLSAVEVHPKMVIFIPKQRPL